MSNELGFAIPYKIAIEPTHNKGFYVKIGCATLVFHNRIALIEALDKYLADPEKWEKEYNSLKNVPQTATEGQPNRTAIGPLSAPRPRQETGTAERD